MVMTTRQGASARRHGSGRDDSHDETVPAATLVERGSRDPLVRRAGGFLQRFGYLGAHKCAHDELCGHLSTALADFQAFYQLEPTGTLTLETVKLMSTPRCALPDFEPGDANRPAALGGPGIEDADPFVFSANKWNQSTLRWFLSGGTPDLTGEANQVQAAMDTWSGVAPLDFVRQFSATGADVDWSWQIGDHGDGDPFDGPGTVLAHAFYPTDGRVHFDDAESWATSGSRDIWTVALHELGHTLGLRHSGVSDAAMYAFIGGERRRPHEVDIKGIRSRYPTVVDAAGRQVISVPLWALESTGGSDVVTVDFGREVTLLAWGAITMVDSRADLDRDNYYAVEVFTVDDDRPGPYLFGGRHFGSDGAPSNCYSGAYVGRGRKVTFRMSVGHMQDVEAFGTGNVIVLSGGK